MNKNLILAVVLGVLVLVSVVQAFQLNSLKEKVSTTTVTAPRPSLPASSGSAPQLPSSIQDLPQMVGGC